MKKNELKDIITVRWSIKWKLVTSITILMVYLVAALSYIQISSQKRILERELNNRIKLMQENLIERGKSSIVNLSQQVEKLAHTHPEPLSGHDVLFPGILRGRACFQRYVFPDIPGDIALVGALVSSG